MRFLGFFLTEAFFQMKNVMFNTINIIKVLDFEMNYSVKMMESDVVEALKYLVLYAIINFDQQYSKKARELLERAGVNGYIIVSRFNRKDLPKCTLACSVGLGVIGIVLMDNELLDSPSYSEELKEFILAHEIAHIIRGHILSKIFIKFLMEFSMQALKDSIESSGKAKDVLARLFDLIMIVFLRATFKFVTEVDQQIVKREELEADEIAIKLAGCHGAVMFAKILEQLKAQGYNISHESILGFPALTLEERIRHIYQKCGQREWRN